MMFRWLPLLTFCLDLLLLLAGAQLATSQELYVKPTEDTSCPEPCHTLDEYVQNVTQYFVSDTTFSFLPGNHSLGRCINISGVTNLALVAINSTVNIVCNDSSLSFTVISNLTLENLTLNSCGTLVLTDLLDLNLLGVSINPPYTTKDYLIMNTINIIGRSVIAGLCTTAFGHLLRSKIEISYNNHSALPLPIHNQLAVKDSFLSCSQLDILDITIKLDQSSYDIDLLFNNLTIVNDLILGYIALEIYITSSAPNNVTLMNLKSVEAILPSQRLAFIDFHDCLDSTSSVFIKNCKLTSVSVSFELMSSEIVIEDTFVDFTANTEYEKGQFAVNLYGSQMPFVANNVTFTGGSPAIGFVLLLKNASNVRFVDCKFRNTVRSDQLELFVQNAQVWIDKSSGVNFTNCEFSNNNETPIASLDSTFILSGSNTFSNNIVPQGGAMALYGHSYVTLANGSDILFINNSAETVGGAIYVDYEVESPCYFILDVEYLCSPRRLDPPAPPVTMKFEGNVAENGGTAVYGASLDTCYMNSNGMLASCQGWMFVNNLFHINQRNGSVLSAISSDPLRACLCDKNGRPSCTTVFTNHTIIPGESFSVSAVVVGDRFGTVDGSVYAQLLPLKGPYVAELESLDRSQRVTHAKCTNLSYTVLSNSSVDGVSLALTANTVQVHQYPDKDTIKHVQHSSEKYNSTGLINQLLRSYPVFINITLLPCPLGFMLSGEPYQCICDTRLQDNRIPCNLTTQTVQRSGTEWVNASFHNNTSNGVIVNKYCPNNYCKPETVNISLEHPDTQCAFNHSGILCGGCHSGLSLALGSDECLSCSNAYLSLIIPFALAGFALVFFIKLLNLTVATGTLNGLIFYANIVRANQVAWIPGHDTNILTVFIAWINLDLGFETCFFDGLNAYWKIWLQFVFPIYIWAIVVLIVLLSRYSSTAAKIFGSNSVPILATLFLLSYSKLLRAIVSIFQLSILDYPDGTSAIVWSYDGNISYFSGKRIPLLLVALMVLLFLCLPYTAVLLFAQCLQRINYHRVAALLMKFKPFFDAYYGPLKDRHRYWVGLLLLVRGALFLVYAATPTSMFDTDLLVTSIAMLCLLVYPANGNLYRKNYLNLLENSFFLNLGVFAVGTFYIQISGGSQAALAYTSVGIAFTLFAAIVLFHAFASLRATRWGTSLRNRCLKLRNPQQNKQDQRDYERIPWEKSETKRPRASDLSVSYSQYRESVLRYEDQ